MGVVRAAARGLAPANVAGSAGRSVALWGRDGEAMGELRLSRRSARLSGVALAERVRVVSDLAALAGCEAILVATPAQTTREMASRLATALSAPRPLVVCAKGVELGTNLFMTEIVGESAPLWPCAILSGPSFAADVAAGLPTAVALAAREEALAVELCRALKGPNLRLYHSTDVRGVEIGGAAKNVLAIACGVASGLGLGPSAGAALIARGFAELRRFGEAFGAEAHTLMGLSGLGDLVLTCSSAQSRNFAFGVDLGRGRIVTEAGGGKLAEGATTVGALMQLARAREIEMPIASSVAAVIAGDEDVRAIVGKLLARPAKAEG